MKIALIGYGKMGKAIEKIAAERGHEIVVRFDSKNLLNKKDLKQADVAIEFSRPELALDHIYECFEADVPVVIGTTGEWYNEFKAVKKACKKHAGAMLHATNFSLGVNLFFELNRKLAKLMNPHLEYAVQVEEIHHTQKLDSPSGTAITIAEQIIDKLNDKTGWVNEATADPNLVSIVSKRIDPVPGTHTVSYTSAIDSIEITHTAFNRTGFALGSVLAAEFLAGKKGVFTMKDLLNL